MSRSGAINVAVMCPVPCLASRNYKVTRPPPTHTPEVINGTAEVTAETVYNNKTKHGNTSTDRRNKGSNNIKSGSIKTNNGNTSGDTRNKGSKSSNSGVQTGWRNEYSVLADQGIRTLLNTGCVKPMTLYTSLAGLETLQY